MKKLYTAGLFVAAALSVNAQQLINPLSTNQPTPSKGEVLEAWNSYAKKTGKKGLINTKAATEFLAEDFEAMEIPVSWPLEQAAGAEGWIADTADVNARWSPTARPDDLWFAVSNDSHIDTTGGVTNDASADYLTTPAVDLSGVSSAAIKVDLFFNPEFSLSTATIEASSDGSTWTSIYTVTANTEWQNDIIISLDNYVGQAAVQVRFGHNDGGGYASGFAIDNVIFRESVVDLGLTLAYDIYSKIPANQVYAIEVAGNVANNEYETATGVTATATVEDPSAATTNLATTLSPDVLNGLEDQDFLLAPTYTQGENGVYTFTFNVASTEADDEPLDNEISFTSEVNDTLFARDNGDVNSSTLAGKNTDIGLGIPLDFYPGNIYNFVNEDTITAVEFVFGADAAAGDEIRISLYGFDGLGEVDFNNVIASTLSAVKTAAAGTAETVVLPIEGGFYDPFAGESLFAAADYIGAAGISTVGTDSTGLVSEGQSSLYLVNAGFGLVIPTASAPVAIRLILGEFDPAAAKPDVLVSNPALSLEYTNTPLVHVKPISIAFDVENKGAGAADDVEAVVTVLADGASVYTNQSSLGTLAGGEVSTNIDLGTFTPSAIGTYQVVLDVNTSTTEDNVANNTDTLVFFVSDSLYNRAAVSLDGLFNFGPNLDVGTGTPDDVTFGSTYELVTPDTITAVSFVTAGDQQVGDEFIVNVYDGAGSPVGNSDVFTVATAGTPNTPSVITLTFGNGLALPVGSYYLEFEAVSTADNQPRTFYMASSIATENTAFITLINQAAEFDIATAFGEPFTPIVEVVLGNAQVVGINEVSKLEVSIYPNPVQDFIKVTNADNSNYAIYNVTGRKVASGKVVNKNTKINTADFNTGIYFIEFTGAVNETVKIVKN